jgi:predicted DNA-binding transcriptional regulator AlpA
METNTPASEHGRAKEVAAPPDERLIRLPATLRSVELGRTAWLDLVRAKLAPQPVRIGRATFWVASEVQEFIAERIRQSRGG